MIAFSLIFTLVVYWEASLVWNVSRPAADWVPTPYSRSRRRTEPPVRRRQIVDDLCLIIIGLVALAELWLRFPFEV